MNPTKRPVANTKKFIVINTQNGLVVEFDSLTKVNAHLKQTAEEIGGDGINIVPADFIVYEVKSRIRFTMKQTVNVNFGE